MRLNDFKYKLTQQHASSDRYGNCEICEKFVSDVYIQTKEQLCSVHGKEFWAMAGSAFGHKECLIRIRR